MFTLDFPPPDGWVKRESSEPDAPLMAFERVASGKGAKNPLIVVKAQPWSRPLDQLPDVTPDELRTASPIGFKVLKEDWNPGGHDDYPYLSQLIAVKRIDLAGQEDHVFVHAAHMLLGVAGSPGGQELMSFELVCRPDDELSVTNEFAELIAGLQIAEIQDPAPTPPRAQPPRQEPRPPQQPPQTNE